MREKFMNLVRKICNKKQSIFSKENIPLENNIIMVIISYCGRNNISWNKRMRHNSIPLPTLSKKKLQKLIVKGMGELVEVPVHLPNSDATFKTNLEWRYNSIRLLAECSYSCVYALFIEKINIFQILKEKDKSENISSTLFSAWNYW